MVFRPMLADNKKVEPAQIQRHLEEDGFLIMQPKIDGMRVLVDDECLPRSRSGKEFKNRFLRTFLRNHPSLRGCDGEIVAGLQYDPNIFRESMSGVRAEDGSSEFTYYVFDYYMEGVDALRYDERRNHVRGLLENLIPDPDVGSIVVNDEEGYTAKLVLCPQIAVTSLDQLNEQEEAYIAAGWEGAILRRAHLPYKHNRSTNREGYLIKLKRYEDDEAVVVGCYPWEHNANEATIDVRGYTTRSSHKDNRHVVERLGGFHCHLLRDPSVTFDIGVFRGWGHSVRDSLWAQRDSLVGKILKFKHQGYGGGYDRPRTPVGLGWRDAIDL